MEKWRYSINVVIVFLLLLTIAVNRSGKIGGTPVGELLEKPEVQQGPPAVTTDSEGNRVINSTSIAADILGYGGPTPLQITLKENKISHIELLPNDETPGFISRVLKKGVISQWIGMPLDEVAEKKVEAVSGATLSSDAINQTVRRSIGYALEKAPSNTTGNPFTTKNIIGLGVIALGVFLTFAKGKSKQLRTLQLILNVGVLGFWCGSFLSLSLLVNWLSGGINLATSLLPLVLLLVALIAPLWGKKNNYCTFHCPMGSLQELTGKCSKKKLTLSPRVLRIMNIVRESILWGMLLLMWVGVGFEIMDYEVFTIFLGSSATTAVWCIGIVFIALSPFINRPYCRFICPTGSLLRFSQQTSK